LEEIVAGLEWFDHWADIANATDAVPSVAKTTADAVMA
jgi:hypothetical protein